LDLSRLPRYAASSCAEPLGEEQVAQKFEALLPRRKALQSSRERFRIFKIVVGVAVPIAIIDAFARGVALFLAEHFGSAGLILFKIMGKALKPERLLFARDLPKTRSAKIMRRVIRATYLGREPGDVSSLENPDAVKAIAEAT